jgi:cellulose synthase (UDP-forming)
VSITDIRDESQNSEFTYIQPYPGAGKLPRPLRFLAPRDPQARAALRLWLLRVVITANLLLGTLYITWRYAGSINWPVWWVAVPLILAETYSFIDSLLFGITMWNWRGARPKPASPPPNWTVDVFITCYNEPVELVRNTARAALAIRYPHRTYILDDGASETMRAMAEEEGVGYIVRSLEWQNRARHAKAGNLINAFYQTDGEFIAILDADQTPAPEFLDRTLGYFHDPKVGFVQTQQFFYNVPPHDPFGAQAPLFYGPIQEAKDGWNAAFFCGSNAVLRREALMFIGVAYYVRDLEFRVRRALRVAERLLRRAERDLQAGGDESDRARQGLRELREVVRDARREMKAGKPVQEITWEFQRRAETVSRLLVADDLARIRAELASIPGLEDVDLDVGLASVAEDEEALQTLSGRAGSPLLAIATVRSLLLEVDVDRSDEVHPIMPMATISVTEDMATAMRMHAQGFTSVYHGENLVVGLAPDDFGSAIKQRLRWAQGTLQVFFRENPLTMRGMKPVQRLMYFATMWSYLSGIFAPIYLLAPVCYLFFGWLPVKALSADFFWHLVPYLVMNEILFMLIGWGRPTYRGRQYSLALFPIWLAAVWTATTNVFLGKKLDFAVTPKTRQGGVSLKIVRWQLIVMGLLAASAIYGLARLALGLTNEVVPILVNVFWICYDIAMLSVVFRAVSYSPGEDESSPASMLAQSGSDTAADVYGRALGGAR